MKGSEVFDVLNGRGIERLHHANSVKTSCTFLEQSGLLSRGYVQANDLNQTPQSMSDSLDQAYKIWHSVFLDHVDIHERAGKKKGPNHYGPVLFLLDLEVLLRLEPGSTVRVTKKNPTNWVENEPESDRWFRDRGELAAGFSRGTFGQMLVIDTPSSRLDFPNASAKIVLDNPQRRLSSDEDAYDHATLRLRAAAGRGQINVSIEQRTCGGGCTCREKYSRWSDSNVDFYFE